MRTRFLATFVAALAFTAVANAQIYLPANNPPAVPQAPAEACTPVYIVVTATPPGVAAATNTPPPPGSTATPTLVPTDTPVAPVPAVCDPTQHAPRLIAGTRVFDLSNLKPWLDFFGIGGAVTWRTESKPITEVVDGDIMTFAGLADVGVTNLSLPFNDKQAPSLTDDLVETGGLHNIPGRCLAVKAPTKGDTKLTGSQLCVDVRGHTDVQVSIWADASNWCQFSAGWAAYMACPVTVESILAAASGDVNWLPGPGQPVEGAQFAPKADWVVPPCATAQMDGATVAVVPAGRMASVWLKDEVKPMRVR